MTLLARKNQFWTKLPKINGTPFFIIRKIGLSFKKLSLPVIPI